MSEKNLTALVWMRCPSKYNGTHLVALLKVAGLSAKYGKASIRVPVLAAMCGVTERAMQKTLKRLRKDGLLTVKHRKCRSSHLTLNVEEIEKLPLVNPNPDNQQEQQAAPMVAEPAKPVVTPLPPATPPEEPQRWDEAPASEAGKLVWGLQGHRAVGGNGLSKLLREKELQQGDCQLWEVSGNGVKQHSVKVTKHGQSFVVVMPNGQTITAAA
jgi:hypothetical protein